MKRITRARPKTTALAALADPSLHRPGSCDRVRARGRSADDRDGAGCGDVRCTGRRVSAPRRQVLVRGAQTQRRARSGAARGGSCTPPTPRRTSTAIHLAPDCSLLVAVRSKWSRTTTSWWSASRSSTMRCSSGAGSTARRRTKAGRVRSGTSRGRG